MKQTKKLTRNQREFLNKKCNIDTTGVRLIEDTKEYIKIQLFNGRITSYDYETGKEITNE